MKTSKRMLALLCTVMMLVTCFALPYGALAAEEAETVINKSDAGQIVATLQGETPAVAQQGGDQWVGKTWSLATPYTFEKAASNYMITLEVMIHQDYGFTDPAWMLKCLGDGNLQIVGKDAEGADVTVSNPVSYTNMLKNGGVNKEDTWFQVQIPLAKLTAASFSKLVFNTYVHACRWDSTNYPTDNSKCKNGCRISYRNVVVRDMSRNAQGGLSETVAVFGQEEVDYTTDHTAATTGAKAIVDYTELSYSVITSDMALEDLYFEFDVMYKGGENATNQNIKNGQLRLYTGNTEHQGHDSWGNNIVNKANTWFHISAPLSGFTGGNALTDPTGITRAYAFNYNDGKAAFTAHAKNVKITYKPMTDAKQALEDAKNFTYDVDDNATAYEAALTDVRSIFTSASVNYTDVAGLLSALDAAEANLTNKQDLSYEVAHYGQHEYAKTQTLNANSNQFWYDWKPWDGMGSVGVDLRDDVNGDITQIGANRYFQVTVTLKPNANFSGEAPTSLDLLKNVNYRVRTNDGTEKRTNDYTTTVLSKKVTDTEAVYVLEGLLDNSARNACEWDDVRQSIIFPYITMNSDANKEAPVTCTLSDVRLVNKTAEAIDTGLKECADAYITPGKYTAASTANYMALQSEAQAMVANTGATMQEKSQLIKRINAAKDEFVAIVPEFVQFGQPEVETTFTNTGINGSHSINKNFNVVNNTVTADTDVSNLKLRIEMFVTRDDGATDASKSFLNGAITIKGTTELKRNGSITSGDMKAGEWNTLYFDLSTFDDSGALSAEALMGATSINLFGYNDYRNSSDNPGITMSLRNIAIVDATNTDAVAALADAFYDVTREGAVDFTPDSLAAYQAVYDEWYPVYQFVDLDHADEAIAAMKEAYSLLVCVDKSVLTFSAFDKEWGNNAGGANSAVFYADWRASDQGMVDITTRNIENLRIRFDYSFKKLNADAADLPETLTGLQYRVSVRKWNSTEDAESKERSFDKVANNLIMSSTGVNTMDMALSDMTNTNDGNLRDIIFWVSVAEAANAAAGDYAMVIENARVVDITKDLMEEQLTADANASVDDFGVANGVVYDENEAGDLKAAQAKALEVLAKENPTYKELDDAQKAIDAAIDGLTAYGHTVATASKYTGVNSWMYGGKKNFYINWTDFDNQPINLAQYNTENLVIRLDVELGLNPDFVEEGWTPDVQPETLTVHNQGFLLQDGTGKGVQLNGHDTTMSSTGVSTIEIPISWFDLENGMDWSNIKNTRWYLSLSNLVDSTTTEATIDGKQQNSKGPYRFNIYNARIVDITAEKNLGTVTEVGNGAVDITGGLKYGTENTLTATTSSSTAKFIGWKVNDQFVPALEGEANTQTLKATGNQKVTAYFVEPDETAVVYYGKYNRVLDVQVVESSDALKEVTPPSIKGYSFANWDVDANSLAANIDSNKGGVVSVEAIYTADTLAEGEGYTVTLSPDIITTADVSGKFRFDTGIKVTAAEKEGQTFSHWTINGAVASCEKELTFYVSGDVVVAAHYVEEGQEVIQVPTADITQSRYVAEESGKYTFEVIGQTFIPDTYELMDYGVVFAPNDDVLAAMMKGEDFDANYILKVVSSSRIANRQYQVSMTGVAAGKTRCAVAYVTFVDANGVVNTVYSAIETVTTPAA